MFDQLYTEEGYQDKKIVLSQVMWWLGPAKEIKWAHMFNMFIECFTKHPDNHFMRDYLFHMMEWSVNKGMLMI